MNNDSTVWIASQFWRIINNSLKSHTFGNNSKKLKYSSRIHNIYKVIYEQADNCCYLRSRNDFEPILGRERERYIQLYFFYKLKKGKITFVVPSVNYFFLFDPLTLFFNNRVPNVYYRLQRWPKHYSV